MKNGMKILTITCATIIIVACSPTASPSLAMKTPTIPSIQSITPTLQPSPSAAADALGDKANLNQKCVSFTEQSPSVDGRVVAVESGLTPILVDVRSGRKIALGGKVFFTVSISPKHDLVAYIDSGRQLLVIINADGKVIKTLPAQQNWRRVLQWLDNDTLLIENFRTPKGGLFIPSSTIAYNLSNGKYQEYVTIYPDLLPSLYYNALHWQQYTTTLAVYSPDLSMVAYPAQSDDETPIVLWDLLRQRQITRIHTQGYWGSAPQWNSDGSRLIVSAPPKFTTPSGDEFSNVSDTLPYVAGNELFTVASDGQVERLTYLTTISNADEEGYVWSPDDKRVAFWLGVDDSQPGWQLAILDVTTQKVTSLCLSEEDYPVPPVWLADGNHLVVTSIDQSKNKSEIILIDITRSSAIRIAENALAMGWLNLQVP